MGGIRGDYSNLFRGPRRWRVPGHGITLAQTLT